MSGLSRQLSADEKSDIESRVSEIFEHTDTDHNGVLTLRGKLLNYLCCVITIRAPHHHVFDLWWFSFNESELCTFNASELSFDASLVRALTREFGFALQLKRGVHLVNEL